MTKLEEWKEFSKKVEDHITNYCVPQYGEYPDKEIYKWTVGDVQVFLRKYIGRVEGIAHTRGPEEQKRDALKIAHYGCYLLKKLEEREIA